LKTDNNKLANFAAHLIDSHFSKCGPIHSIRLLYKPSEEDRNEGIAKIRFMEKWQAAEAILDFDGTKWKGAKLRCEWWNKRRVGEQGNGLQMVVDFLAERVD
jgi:RNA recognition motif-containing protein